MSDDPDTTRLDADPTPDDGRATPTPGDGRRRLLALAAGLIVLAIAVVAIVLGTRDEEGDRTADEGSTSTSAPSSATAESSGSAVPSPTDPAEAGGEDALEGSGVPVEANEPPPSLSAVPLDREVEVDGITGSVVQIEEIEGSALGVGNINGPALRVTVRLVNGGSDELSLANVAVSAFYGAERTPASPLEDRSQSPFSGALPGGDAAEGVYVFSVPADQREKITLEVGVAPGADVIVFTGTV